MDEACTDLLDEVIFSRAIYERVQGVGGICRREHIARSPHRDYQFTWGQRNGRFLEHLFQHLSLGFQIPRSAQWRPTIVSAGRDALYWNSLLLQKAVDSCDLAHKPGALGKHHVYYSALFRFRRQRILIVGIHIQDITPLLCICQRNSFEQMKSLSES